MDRIRNILQRGTFALEEGDFGAAEQFFESALDLDATCGEAYWGKLLAQSRVKDSREFVHTQLMQAAQAPSRTEKVQITPHQPRDC